MPHAYTGCGIFNNMNTIPNMTGYKATDKDMMCRDTQFALGVWSEPVAGDLELCKNGYHFCKHPSGVYGYYSHDDTRVFEIEAEDALEAPATPGAEYKLVARRVKLLREIIPTNTRIGHSNTGARNTGDCNTGDCNTGYGNTGDRNTGDDNTGHENVGGVNTGTCNTGDGNTGYGNTGDGNAGVGNTGARNTGDCNTGDCNTGQDNTGDRNTGDYNNGDKNNGDKNTGDCNTGVGNIGDNNAGHRNTGFRNTGDCNTGDGNAGIGNTGDCNTGIGNITNYATGLYCTELQTVKCFDVDTGLTMKQFHTSFPSGNELDTALRRNIPIVFNHYKHLPGITLKKLNAYVRKYKASIASL